MNTLEELIVGRNIEWNELEYDLENSNTYEVHSFSGVIIGFNDYYAVVQLDGGTERKAISLNELPRHIEHEPDFLKIYWAVSRHTGALRRAEKLADRTPHDIYALIDPRDKIIRYVGVSKQVGLRYEQHLNLSGTNERKNAWIRNLKENGLQPELTILEHIEGRYYARRREEYWISYYLEMGLPLTNVDTPFIDAWNKKEVAS